MVPMTQSFSNKNFTSAGLLCLAVLFSSAGKGEAWSQKDVDTGANNHPLILQQQGGSIQNLSLIEYVNTVGHRVIEASGFAHEPWTITITDTPSVNAFASPGGYIYITRGLLAVANSEAELAAVIGHEAAHLTTAHHEKREDRDNKAGLGVIIGTILGGIFGGEDGLKKGIEFSSKVAKGYTGTFSQRQEFEADEIGIQYIAKAGYNPMGQADFLANLAIKKTYEGETSGNAYNPNRVDLFATHPATAERIERARELARAAESDLQAKDNRTEYLKAIDGMIYGDSPAQGYVMDKTFAHPELRFSYTVPQTFNITNSATRIVAKGPQQSQFILDGGGPASGSMIDYIKHVWVKQIDRDADITGGSAIKTYQRNGVDAAFTTLNFNRGDAPWVGQLTLIKHGDGFIRLTGMAPANAPQILKDMKIAAESFSALSPQDAAKLKPHLIGTKVVSKGGQPEDFVNEAMPVGLFLALNGLESPADLEPGQTVKILTQ